MRKTIAKAVTWRLIGTTEIFAISFWTTGHIATAGNTAVLAAISSLVLYVVHELAWERASVSTGMPRRAAGCGAIALAARLPWSRPKPSLAQNAISEPSNEPVIPRWRGRAAGPPEIGGQLQGALPRPVRNEHASDAIAEGLNSAVREPNGPCPLVVNSGASV